MSIRNMVYIALSLVSVAWAWSWGFQWMAGGGNLLNLPSFFLDSDNSGSAAAFLPSTLRSSGLPI
jgi:hypothetical protein